MLLKNLPGLRPSIAKSAAGALFLVTIGPAICGELSSTILPPATGSAAVAPSVAALPPEDSIGQLSPATSIGVQTIKHLAPGITFTQEINKDIPLVIDVVTVDLTARGVHVNVGIAQDHIGGPDPTDGREEVSSYARRHHAVAAVNGDYFPFTGDPLGVAIHGGELYSEPWIGMAGKGGPRSVLGFTGDDNRIVIDRVGFEGEVITADGARSKLHGIDRMVGKDELVILTPSFRAVHANRPGGTDVVVTGVNLPLRANKLMRGTVASIRVTPDGVDSVPPDGVLLVGGPAHGAATIAAHLHAGEPIQFVVGIASVQNPAAGVLMASAPRDNEDEPSRSGAAIDRTAWLWGRMREAVGGGPRLLVNGNIVIDNADEGFDDGFVGFPYPRTAAGISNDGHRLYIVTVDGRQSISHGVSLYDMAAILKRYGATDAINLDGGGSTTMAINGVVVDSPGGAGSERPVADMLTVSSDHPTLTIPNWDTAGCLPAMQVASDQAGGQSLADQAPYRLAPGKAEMEEGQSTQIAFYDHGKMLPAGSSQVVWQGPVRSVPPPNEPAVALGAPGSSDVSPLPEPAPSQSAAPPNSESRADNVPVQPSSPGPAMAQLGSGIPSGTATGDAPATMAQPLPAAAQPPADPSGSSASPQAGAPAAEPAVPLAGAPLIIGAAAPRPDVLGFVDQRGNFTALHSGVGVVTALYHGKLVTATITVNPRTEEVMQLTTIRASLTADPSGAENRSILSIHVIRGDGSPVAGLGVRLLVQDGQADSDIVTTDPDGAAGVSITWEKSQGGLVTVSSPGLSAVTVGQ